MQTPVQEIYDTRGEPDYLRWPCIHFLRIAQGGTGRSQLLRGRPERGVIYIPEH
jgi:hypothetical protein